MVTRGRLFALFSAAVLMISLLFASQVFAEDEHEILSSAQAGELERVDLKKMKIAPIVYILLRPVPIPQGLVILAIIVDRNTGLLR